jgi:hypothetical protein
MRQDGVVMGFVAYDSSNSSNRVHAYSVLEQATCPTTKHHHNVERTIFRETVQMKGLDHACLLLYCHRVHEESVLGVQLSRRSGPVPNLQGAEASGGSGLPVHQDIRQTDCGRQGVPGDP